MCAHDTPRYTCAFVTKYISHKNTLLAPNDFIHLYIHAYIQPYFSYNISMLNPFLIRQKWQEESTKWQEMTI